MRHTWQDIEDLLTYYGDKEGSRECVMTIRDALWGLPDAGEYRKIRLEQEK